MRNLFLPLLFLLGMAGISKAQTIHTCTEMSVRPLIAQSVPLHLPEAASRAVSYKPQYGLYWSNGSTIKVKFIGGSNFVRNRVKQYASLWTKYVNLNFQFVSYGQADIRVSFVENGSSWSVIGKQALQLGQNEPTMNFGWLNERTPEYEFRRTILHEFGHALGLLHEHQNPSGGIPWNESAVYSHYRQTHGWDKQTTYENVIQKAQRNQTQFSAYDPASIMHYPVSASLTNGKYQVGMNQHLSATDIAYIKQIYPGRNNSDSGNNSNNQEENRPEILTERPTSQQKYTISISNRLGQNQVSETVDLYLGGEKYTFELSKHGQRQKTFRFRMTPGQYTYRLSSASTYRLTQKVWNGWQYVRKKINKTIYGSGSGNLEVTGNGNMTLYGDYDADSGRMKVYLGTIKNNRMATVQEVIGDQN